MDRQRKRLLMQHYFMNTSSWTFERNKDMESVREGRGVLTLQSKQLKEEWK